MYFHNDFQSTILCHYGVDVPSDSPSIMTSSYSCHYGVCCIVYVIIEFVVIKGGHHNKDWPVTKCERQPLETLQDTF